MWTWVVLCVINGQFTHSCTPAEDFHNYVIAAWARTWRAPLKLPAECSFLLMTRWPVVPSNTFPFTSFQNKPAAKEAAVFQRRGAVNERRQSVKKVTLFLFSVVLQICQKHKLVSQCKDESSAVCINGFRQCAQVCRGDGVWHAESFTVVPWCIQALWESQRCESQLINGSFV